MFGSVDDKMNRLAELSKTHKLPEAAELVAGWKRNKRIEGGDYNKAMQILFKYEEEARLARERIDKKVRLRAKAKEAAAKIEGLTGAAARIVAARDKINR